MAADSAADAAATAAAEAAAISLDITDYTDLLGSMTGEYIYYGANSDYLDSDGYYISPKFDSLAIELLDTLEENTGIEGVLSSGEVGIMYEVFDEELNENQIVLYYALSDSDDPTVTNAESEAGSLSQYYVYDSAEELALQEKYGGSEDPESFITDLITSLSVNVATAAVNAEYTFKKIKYDDLDYDNLSSFEEDEAEQSVSVATTFVSGAY